MNRLDKFYRIEKQHFQFNEIMKWNRNKSLKLTTFNRKKNKCIFFPQHLQDKTADFYTWPLQNINRYIQKLSITNSTTKNIVEVVTPILPSISNIALKSSFETHTTPGMKVLKHFFFVERASIASIFERIRHKQFWLFWANWKHNWNSPELAISYLKVYWLDTFSNSCQDSFVDSSQNCSQNSKKNAYRNSLSELLRNLF